VGLRVCRLALDVAEVSAVVSVGGPVRRALALRVQETGGGWVVTALEARGLCHPPG
jgi:Family of unknown function (DUF6459)